MTYTMTYTMTYAMNIMQCVIERHRKEHGYKVGIVRGKEFRQLQGTLNAKAITRRQNEKGKRPSKTESLEPEEEMALWKKGQLGDFNARNCLGKYNLQKSNRATCDAAARRITTHTQRTLSLDNKTCGTDKLEWAKIPPAISGNPWYHS